MQVGRQSRECEPRRPAGSALSKRPNASVIVDIAIDTVTELPRPDGSMPSWQRVVTRD